MRTIFATHHSQGVREIKKVGKGETMKDREHRIMVSQKPTKRRALEEEAHADSVKAKIMTSQEDVTLMMEPLMTSGEALSAQ